MRIFDIFRVPRGGRPRPWPWRAGAFGALLAAFPGPGTARAAENALPPPPFAAPPATVAVGGQPSQVAQQVNHLRLAADNGDPVAMMRLGQLAEAGAAGVTRNFTEAFNWYLAAARAGHPAGLYNVGVCYEIGQGVAANGEAAARNFSEAAEKGLARAHYKLAALYLKGDGALPPDTAKGLAELRQAAEGGLARAASELAVIHLQGLFQQPQNGREAIKCFRRAAELGDMEAAKNIAVIYKDGLGGVPADAARAVGWYRICLRYGYSPREVIQLSEQLADTLGPVRLAQAQALAERWIDSFETRRAEQRAGGSLPSPADLPPAPARD